MSGKACSRPPGPSGNTRLYSDEDVKRLEIILNLVRDLGVNLAGVEVVLNMRAKIERIEAEVQSFLESFQREFFSGRKEEFEARKWSLVPVSPSKDHQDREDGLSHAIPGFRGIERPAALSGTDRPLSPHHRGRGKEAGRKIHAGDEEALQKLIEGNLRFVVSYVKKYKGMGLGTARPDQRGEPRSDRGGQALRPEPQRQVHLLCRLVDPAGRHPLPDASSRVTHIPQKMSDQMLLMKRKTAELGLGARPGAEPGGNRRGHGYHRVRRRGPETAGKP